jgi:hypothetical protein
MTNKDAEEIAELAVRLAYIYPVRPQIVARAVLALRREGQRAVRLAEDQCNRQPKTAREFDNRERAILVRCDAALASLGAPKNAPVRVRGYCLRLHHSMLPGNTMGGDAEGYGVA